MSKNILQIFNTSAALSFVGTDLMYLGRAPYGAGDDFAFQYATLAAQFVSSSAIVDGAHGGTGVANTGKTITIGGNFTTTGAFNPTLAFQASNTYTFPVASQTLLGLAGGTMTGNLFLNADPSSATQAATKNYVDTVASGFTVKMPCYAASTTALTVTYDNVSVPPSGVGATLTNAGTQAVFELDGINPPLSSRVLIKNQSGADELQNGIYTVTDVGSGATNWVLTRATDYDQPAEIKPGDLVLITNGNTLSGSAWLQTDTVTSIGVDAIAFSQFGASFPLSLSNGGTGKALVASNGGIVYSDASTFEILAGTATASKMLLSGASSAPTWSTSTIPTSSGAGGKILISDGTNYVNSTPTYPNTSGTLNHYINSDGTNNVYSTYALALSGDVTTGGAVTFSGAFAFTATLTNTTSITFPVSGTLLNNTLASANFYVGNGSNVATGVAMSGDAALSNTGGVTVSKIGGVAISLAGSFTTSGAFAVTQTYTAPTNVTFPTSGTLATTSQIPSFPLSLANGGTNADLSLQASNGGIVWSNATQMQILAGTATARQMLQSGASSTPAWSTSTWPATTTLNAILFSSSANVVGEITPAASSVLITSAGNVPSLSQTLPSTVQGNITSVGTIASGIWNGTVIGGTYGGTGVNNGVSTITIGGNVTFSGAFTFNGTVTGNTAVTFPTSGTLVNDAVTTLSSLASIGTITTGVWHGTVVGTTWGGTGVADPSAHGIMIAEGSSPMTPIVLTNGQVLIGSTGADPVASTLTAGTNISISNAAGSITINATGIGGFTWNDVSGTTQAAAVNNGYIISNAAQTTVTLPSTAAEGSVIAVQGKGAGGWILAANSGQTIKLGSSTTTTAGSLTSTNLWDAIEVICVTANTTWATRSVIGNLTVA